MTTEGLEAVSGLVGHLRWRVGEPSGDDLTGVDLVADPAHFAGTVAATAAGRGSDDPVVLRSLWWQAYAYRLAGTTLAAWVVGGRAPDPSADGAGVGVARSRPSSLLVDPSASPIDDLRSLVDATFAGHLDPLAARLRADRGLGEQLVWGNAAAALASALGAVATAEGAPPLGARIEQVLGVLPHGIAGLGTWTVPPSAGFGFRRRTCCLWWKTNAAAGALCEDCSLDRGASR